MNHEDVLRIAAAADLDNDSETFVDDLCEMLENRSRNVPIALESKEFLESINFPHAVSEKMLQNLKVMRNGKIRSLFFEITFWRENTAACSKFMGDLNAHIRANRLFFQNWEKSGGMTYLRLTPFSRKR